MTINKYNGIYYMVYSKYGLIYETQDIQQAYKEYHYQRHTLSNIDIEEMESIKLIKEIYANGRLINSYEYEVID